LFFIVTLCMPPNQQPLAELLILYCNPWNRGPDILRYNAANLHCVVLAFRGIFDEVMSSKITTYHSPAVAYELYTHLIFVMLTSSIASMDTLVLKHRFYLPCVRLCPPFYFLNNSVKNWPILILFGALNAEKIWHEHLTDLSTSPVRCSYFSLGNPKKVIFQHYCNVMSMWSLRWHFTNKSVAGAPYSIKS